jgi:hypothetical protein
MSPRSPSPMKTGSISFRIRCRAATIGISTRNFCRVKLPHLDEAKALYPKKAKELDALFNDSQDTTTGGETSEADQLRYRSCADLLHVPSALEYRPPVRYQLKLTCRSGGMADAPDSKSGGVNPREGSSPSSGTNLSFLHSSSRPPSIYSLTVNRCYYQVASREDDDG